MANALPLAVAVHVATVAPVGTEPADGTNVGQEHVTFTVDASQPLLVGTVIKLVITDATKQGLFAVGDARTITVT